MVERPALQSAKTLADNPTGAGGVATSKPLSRDVQDDALAAEYAADVLSAPEKAEVEARIRTEPDFALRVATWMSRMQPVGTRHSPAKTPEPAPSPEPLSAPGETGPSTPQVKTPRPAKTVRPHQGFLSRLIGWQAGALFATSLVLAAMALSVPPQSQSVLQLAAADGRLVYEVREVGGELWISRITGKPAGKGMDYQLWLLAPGANPVSLGLLRDEPLRFARPEPVSGLGLGISLEPLGGSTIVGPSGPVVLTSQFEG